MSNIEKLLNSDSVRSAADTAMQKAEAFISSIEKPALLDKVMKMGKVLTETFSVQQQTVHDYQEFRTTLKGTPIGNAMDGKFATVTTPSTTEPPAAPTAGRGMGPGGSAPAA